MKSTIGCYDYIHMMLIINSFLNGKKLRTEINMNVHRYKPMRNCGGWKRNYKYMYIHIYAFIKITPETSNPISLTFYLLFQTTDY